MPEPEFRQATPADAKAIAAIGGQVWDELAEGSGFPQRPTLEGITDVLERERAAIFVGEKGRSVSGFALLTPDPEDAEQAVMGVWLLPEDRRQGIGRELALMATDFARSAGFGKLRGIIPKANEPALSFFSDIGNLAQMVGQGMEYELPL